MNTAPNSRPPLRATPFIISTNKVPKDISAKIPMLRNAAMPLSAIITTAMMVLLNRCCETVTGRVNMR